VANVHAMSMGVTLTIAKTMIFFSNSFSLEKRLQAEDRFHRIGQDVSVQIIDLVAENTVDEHVAKSMREKFDIQRLVTGDRLREWIK
jgi:SNF2 family DNA or RNA helicase